MPAGRTRGLVRARQQAGRPADRRQYGEPLSQCSGRGVALSLRDSRHFIRDVKSHSWTWLQSVTVQTCRVRVLHFHARACKVEPEGRRCVSNHRSSAAAFAESPNDSQVLLSSVRVRRPGLHPTRRQGNALNRAVPPAPAFRKGQRPRRAKGGWHGPTSRRRQAS